MIEARRFSVKKLYCIIHERAQFVFLCFLTCCALTSMLLASRSPPFFFFVAGSSAAAGGGLSAFTERMLSERCMADEEEISER